MGGMGRICEMGGLIRFPSRLSSPPARPARPAFCYWPAVDDFAAAGFNVSFCTRQLSSSAT